MILAPLASAASITQTVPLWTAVLAPIVALVGVLLAARLSGKNAIAAEDRRAKNAIAAEDRRHANSITAEDRRHENDMRRTAREHLVDTVRDQYIALERVRSRLERATAGLALAPNDVPQWRTDAAGARRDFDGAFKDFVDVYDEIALLGSRDVTSEAALVFTAGVEVGLTHDVMLGDVEVEGISATDSKAYVARVDRLMDRCTSLLDAMRRELHVDPDGV